MTQLAAARQHPPPPNTCHAYGRAVADFLAWHERYDRTMHSGRLPARLYYASHKSPFKYPKDKGVTLVPRTYKPRKRGTRVKDEDKLRARYEAATVNKRRSPAWREPKNIFDATGDPLAKQDPELAAGVYGLTNAPRVNVALRRIRGRTFGDSLSGLTDMAIWFQEHRGWSVLRSAGEAVALAAERGTLIGVRVPVSFDRAVELVRKAVGRAHVLGRLRYEPRGWTGRYMFVVPASGLLVSMPAPLPPRTRLPVEGAWVKDDSFWRRRLRDHDVMLKSGQEENHPTIEPAVAAI